MSGLDIVIAKLVSTPDVTAIVTDARIYPIAFPQNAILPAIVVNLVGSLDTPTLQGAGQYYRDRISAEFLAATADTAVTLGKAARDSLVTTVKETVGSFKDVDILFADSDMTDSDDARLTFRRVMDFYVQWRE